MAPRPPRGRYSRLVVAQLGRSNSQSCLFETMVECASEKRLKEQNVPHLVSYFRTPSFSNMIKSSFPHSAKLLVVKFVETWDETRFSKIATCRMNEENK